MFSKKCLFLILVASIMVTCVGCNESRKAINKSRKAIEVVLEEDASVEPFNGNTIEQLIAHTESRVTLMKSISLQDCPREFKQAYRTHISAWEMEL
ncbi:MAG: hypothetical protein J5654_12850, partial [Victivallales bacterium]|nr:hypothetical protein [Victivallales bacterium]